MKKKFNIIIILLFAVLLFACGIEEPNENSNASVIKADNLAPDFSVELLSGETVNLSDFRGKVVFINFWATWCGPCVLEMPDIQRLSEVYADDLVVLAVNCNERKDVVERFIEENGYTFNVGLDDGPVQNLYPTNGIPYTIVIDADGVISQTHLGGGRNMFPVFEEYVKNALNK